MCAGENPLTQLLLANVACAQNTLTWVCNPGSIALVDADLKGLPEPLADAEHGHVARKPTCTSHVRVASVCTGALQVRVA
jgi:hypothetical protein